MVTALRALADGRVVLADGGHSTVLEGGRIRVACGDGTYVVLDANADEASVLVVHDYDGDVLRVGDD